VCNGDITKFLRGWLVSHNFLAVGAIAPWSRRLWMAMMLITVCGRHWCVETMEPSTKWWRRWLSWRHQRGRRGYSSMTGALMRSHCERLPSERRGASTTNLSGITLSRCVWPTNVSVNSFTYLDFCFLRHLSTVRCRFLYCILVANPYLLWSSLVHSVVLSVF